MRASGMICGRPSNRSRCSCTTAPRGGWRHTLQQILLERAKAGIRVFVLYDAFGTVDIPQEHRETLRAGGVIVEPFRPIRLSTLHLAQNRSHVRGIVIDSRIGWTGGFGIDDKWLGDGRSNGSWRETNVRFVGPAVRQLQAAFAAAWVEATGVLFTGRATLAPQENGVTAAGLLYTSPTLGSTAAERFFALSIAGARKTLYITNAYFAPDRSFIELLAASARRGVDVRILTAGSRTDVNIVRLAGRAWYATLLERRRAGVRMAALDAARQDVRRRRRMAHDRIDEFRQPLDGTQRRGDTHGVGSNGRRSKWNRSSWRTSVMLRRLRPRHSADVRGSSGSPSVAPTSSRDCCEWRRSAADKPVEIRRIHLIQSCSPR